MESTTYILQSIKFNNQETVALNAIPVLDYASFFTEIDILLSDPECQCFMYYAFPYGEGLKYICAIGNDHTHIIHLLSHETGLAATLASITVKHPPMHIFEREIKENFGIGFEGHPWLKPVRFSHDRKDQKIQVNDYPFYKIQGNELHEVGVGPIHAGVIEPGHFRFLCNGETVMHLEIQLGWQHRGVEALFLNKTKLIQRTLLSESITGFNVLAYSLTFCHLMESLGKVKVSPQLEAERAIALELERLAVHTGDLGAMCTDIAYQLGASVFGALRTPLINFTQQWCGNRFGKSLNRVGGTHYPLNEKLVKDLHALLDDYEKRFNEIADHTFSLPSVLKRFEGIGTISTKQARNWVQLGW